MSHEETYVPEFVSEDSLEGFNEKTVGIHKDSIKRVVGKQIYSSKTVALTEMYSNAVTAIQDAQREGYLQDDEGEFYIKIRNEDDALELTISDNGIGMTENILVDVFSELGVTTSGSKTGSIGKFGQGVASYPTLVGFEEGLVPFETNPRESPEAYKGMFGIDPFYHKEVTPSNLDYLNHPGTAYKIVVDSDLQLNEWIETISEYNEVDITVDWPSHTETYPSTCVEDKFNKTNPHISITEEGLYKVVAGVGVPDETLLHYRQIESDISVSNCPFKQNVFVKILTDSQKVVEGKHKGKVLVDDSLYDRLSKEKKKQSIPQSQVDEHVTTTPRIIANRETLKDETGFGQFIAEQLKSELYTSTESLLEKIDSSDSYFSLSTFNQNLLEIICKQKVFSRKYGYSKYKKEEIERTSKISRGINECTDNSFDVTEDTLSICKLLFTSEYINSNDANVQNTVSSIEGERRNRNTDVYMGVSIHDKKKKVVKEHDSETIIINLERADYDFFKSLPWKKLKNVYNNLDELDIPQSLKEKITSSSSDSTNNSTSTLKFHTGRRQRLKYDMDVTTLKNKLQTDSLTKIKTPIILFPPQTDYNLSDFYDYLKRTCSISNCSKKEFEELNQFDSVYSIDEIISKHSDWSEPSTKHHSVSLTTAIQDTKTAVIGIEDKFYDELLEIFQTKQELNSRLKSVINNNSITTYSVDLSKCEDIVTVSHSDFSDNRFIFGDITNNHLYSLSKLNIENIPIETKPIYNGDENRLIAYLSLNEWVNTPRYTELCNNITSYSNPKEMITLYREALEKECLKETDSELCINQTQSKELSEFSK